MENSLYVALSRQLVAKRDLDVIANNIANTSTPGFKGERMMFVEYMVKAKGADEISFVQDLAVARDYSEGTFRTTGNTLDMAIHGEGWFVLDSDDGDRYTRDGHFRLDERGQLVTTHGDTVQGRGGGPIVFAPGDTNIVIASDGTISVDGEQRGRVQVVSFENEQMLRKVANNVYKTDERSTPVDNPEVVQGMMEESNVKPILEMTRMMSALRSYQGAQKLIDTDHNLQRKAIERLMQN